MSNHDKINQNNLLNTYNEKEKQQQTLIKDLYKIK